MKIQKELGKNAPFFRKRMQRYGLFLHQPNISESFLRKISRFISSNTYCFQIQLYTIQNIFVKKNQKAFFRIFTQKNVCEIRFTLLLCE